MKLKPNNPRRITDEELERLEIDLERFGDLSGIVHNEATDYLVGGNQRANVMEIVDEGALTIEHEYDPPTRTGTTAEGFFTWRGERYVYRRVRWDADKEDAACVIANLRGGDWDWDALGDWNVDDLVEWGFDVEELALEGFDFGEDEPPDDPGAQVDRAEELREKWGVSDGDLWRLGDHRLVCGDCTDAAVVARVMDGEKARLCFTSPPYVDMREYGGDDLSTETLIEFIPASVDRVDYFCVNLGIKRKEGVVVPYWDLYTQKATELGLKLLSWNVWDQGQVGAVGKLTAMFPIEHEFIFVYGKKTTDLNCVIQNKSAGSINTSVSDRQFDGSTKKKRPIKIRSKREMGTIARVNVSSSGLKALHPASFPVGLPELYIESFCGDLGIVYDPFLGSGTTLIACEKLGRRCRAIEISPAYCAVAIERWAEMTGGTPELVE